MRVCLVVAVAIFLSCGAKKQQQAHLPAPLPATPAANAPPPPEWVLHVAMEPGKLCGLGVAGAAYDPNSPYPKQMSAERAARNLAGAIETAVQEAIIDKATNTGQSIEMARDLHVDETLVQQIAEMAKTDYWLDSGGCGPFQQRNFTYARCCVDAKTAAQELKLDTQALQKGTAAAPAKAPAKIPSWINRTGKQPGGRLCAVGFSLPTFHPDKTFEVVIEDIRSQLVEVLETLVSSYSEELTTKQYQLYEMMTVASTQAISKGAVVTDFWYDHEGIGPNKRKRSTYGWGCVYPVDVMQKTVQQVEKTLPENVVQQVRERAQKAFDELDAETAKRETSPVVIPRTNPPPNTNGPTPPSPPAANPPNRPAPAPASPAPDAPRPSEPPPSP